MSTHGASNVVRRRQTDIRYACKVCLYRCACKVQSMLGGSKDKGEKPSEIG